MHLTDPLAFGVAMGGIALGASSFLLGETETLTTVSADWIHVAGGMTSLGFAVWYAWYTTTRVMPEKDKMHAETIGKLVTEFREEVQEQRMTHKSEIERLSARFDRDGR